MTVAGLGETRAKAGLPTDTGETGGTGYFTHTA